MSVESLSPAVELPTDSLGVVNGCPVPLSTLIIYAGLRCPTTPCVPPIQLSLIVLHLSWSRLERSEVRFPMFNGLGTLERLLDALDGALMET